MYSRAMAIIGGFLVLASGAGEVYRQKPRTRSLQSTGQVFLGIYLICVVSLSTSEALEIMYQICHSRPDSVNLTDIISPAGLLATAQ